jgi:cytochrome c-type biogenesis protein CcmE
MTKKMRDRLFNLLALLCIAGGVTLWVTYSFKENMLFFLTPDDWVALNSDHPARQGKRFRLGGLVEEGSIHRDDLDLIFVVKGYKDQLKVTFKGLPPDLFRENQGVIAEGRMENSVFKADRILAKHDERYMPKDVADRLKKDNLWKAD